MRRPSQEPGATKQGQKALFTTVVVNTGLDLHIQREVGPWPWIPSARVGFEPEAQLWATRPSPALLIGQKALFYCRFCERSGSI